MSAMEIEEKRCPNCGAMVVEGAEWCSLCYTSLKEPEPEPQPEPEPAQVAEPEIASPLVPPPLSEARTDAGTAAPGDANAKTDVNGKAGEKKKVEAVWACPVCEEENSFDMDACRVCGTPFGKLFEEKEPEPLINPRSAALSSIVPGLGQWRCGKRGEGFARFVAFLWAVTVGYLVLKSKGTSGLLGPIGVLFLLSGIAVAVFTANDAYRLASGRPQLLGMRLLMWAFGALILIFVIAMMGVFLTAQTGA
ncbi:MAG: hypothetical protein WD276_08685 [Actinomycetota bacterium]